MRREFTGLYYKTRFYSYFTQHESINKKGMAVKTTPCINLSFLFKTNQHPTKV